MIFGKKMSKQELGELREINKVLKTERFKAYIVAKNSYRVFKGQQWLKTQTDLINLLEEEQNNLISAVAQRLGFEIGIPVEVDLENGKLHARPDKKNDPVNNPVDNGEKVEESKEEQNDES